LPTSCFIRLHVVETVAGFWRGETDRVAGDPVAYGRRLLGGEGREGGGEEETGNSHGIHGAPFGARLLQVEMRRPREFGIISSPAAMTHAVERQLYGAEGVIGPRRAAV
jgi:hypothetical protein